MIGQKYYRRDVKGAAGYPKVVEQVGYDEAYRRIILRGADWPPEKGSFEMTSASLDYLYSSDTAPSAEGGFL